MNQKKLGPPIPSGDREDPCIIHASQPEITLIEIVSGRGLWICGDPKLHQERLKTMGGQWNSTRKCWVFSAEQLPALLDYFQYYVKEVQKPTPEVTGSPVQ
jgi:hypothetical protein